MGAAFLEAPPFWLVLEETKGVLTTISMGSPIESLSFEPRRRSVESLPHLPLLRALGYGVHGKALPSDAQVVRLLPNLEGTRES